MKRTCLFAIAPVAALLLVLVLAAPQPESGEPAWNDAERPEARAAHAASLPARTGFAESSARCADGAGDASGTELGDEEDGAAGLEPERLAALVLEALRCGAINGLDVLDRIRAEDDPGVVEALFEALVEASEEGIPSDVLAAWLEMARDEPDPSKRWSAVEYLGALADPDGSVRHFLLDLALGEPDEEIRFAALGALSEHVDANPSAALEVTETALDLARSASDPEFRAEALSAVHLWLSGRGSVSVVAEFLADGSEEVRLVAADVLAGARAEDREEVLRLLARTYASETDLDVRAVVLDSIVQVGRHRAAEVLRSLRERDPQLALTLASYVAVLDEGEVDIERIRTEVAERMAE